MYCDIVISTSCNDIVTAESPPSIIDSRVILVLSIREYGELTCLREYGNPCMRTMYPHYMLELENENEDNNGTNVTTRTTDIVQFLRNVYLTLHDAWKPWNRVCDHNMQARTHHERWALNVS
jgi:hypothetical protein